MKPYELTYIISSALTSEDADNLRKDIDSLIQNSGGVILKSEKTVPQSLAYPIKRQSSGYFTILEFQIEENKLKEIKDRIQKDNKILRHFIIIKKPIKEMRERRSRRPLSAMEGKIKTKSDKVEAMEEKVKAKTEKIEMENIDKKLDEILSE